jgi:hypothetical protein
MLATGIGSQVYAVSRTIPPSDDTLRGTWTTGVREYALPETDAGRVHLTVEVGAHTPVEVTIELVSDSQVSREQRWNRQELSPHDVPPI